MKKFLIIFAIVVLVVGGLAAASFFISSNSKGSVQYETYSPFISSIEKKTVATGSVVPEDEVEIKPQITGIVDKILKKEGDKVKSGDLIAIIKVVPNEQALNQAQGRVRNAELARNNAKIEYDRSKALYDKGVISSQDYLNLQLTYDRAEQELKNAKADYQIIRRGTAGGITEANTNIRALVSGTILEIPVKIGDQVIQSNNFNAGTTVAILADLSKMIFEGQVDEGEVGKLKVGMPLTITMGAIEDKEYEATLRFVAPKGTEEGGAVQFKIEGDVSLDEEFQIRAGYSANASFVLESRDSVLVIQEALLQFDRSTNEPYVEVLNEEGKFERRDIEIGLSDGINVEIISGLTEEDKVKEWNKTQPIKKGDEEEEDAENNE